MPQNVYLGRLSLAPLLAALFFLNPGLRAGESGRQLTPGPSCGASATKIHAIQGDGSTTPFAGTTQTIEGVVVGEFQGKQALRGFFVQEEDSDKDDNRLTSEGVFVFAADTSVAVHPGNVVRVTGKVSEYHEMTQLRATAIEVCSTGASVTPGVLTLPFERRVDLERLEGMAIVVPQKLTVTENYNLGRYGTLTLSAGGRLFSPTQVAKPGIAAQAVESANNRRHIILDDGSTKQNPAVIPYPAPALTADNPVRAGDGVQGLQGVLHYAFGEYRIQPTRTPLFVSDNPRTAMPKRPVGGGLRVASFNVLNYFTGNGSGNNFPTSRGADTATELKRQRAKIVATLIAMDADVVGLTEIENNGYGPKSAIHDLVKGLADAGSHYAIVTPGAARIGSDEIGVGFLYNPKRVEPIHKTAVLDSSADERFNDTYNRPVQAQTFREIATQEVLTVALAHLKSKGTHCDGLHDPDMADGQGHCNRTRTAAAHAMVDWLALDPTGSEDNDILIIGDLNAYAKEDPIAVLEAGGFTNLLQDRVGDQAYTYIFKGLAGSLDYALASPSLNKQVKGILAWHTNADEPRALDYNQEFKTPAQRKVLYAADVWRASDHDPLLVQLDLSLAVPAQETSADDALARPKIKGR